MTLSSYPLRIRFNVETKNSVDSVSGGSTTSIWRGNEVSISVAVFFKGAPLDLTNVARLVLQVKEAQNPAAGALAEVEVLAEDITALITAEAWDDESAANAVFEFSSAQMNLDLNGGASRNFFMVLSGLTDVGKPITYGAITFEVREDNAGSDDDPPTPADSYYTSAEIDALLALYVAGGIVTLNSSAEIRLVDTAEMLTGTFRAVYLESAGGFGFIRLEDGVDADAGTDYGPWRPHDFSSRVWHRRL